MSVSSWCWRLPDSADSWSALREEIFGQFTEVGHEIRFLSEQIAEEPRRHRGRALRPRRRRCTWAKLSAPRGSIFENELRRSDWRWKTRWAYAQRRRAMHSPEKSPLGHSAEAARVTRSFDALRESLRADAPAPGPRVRKVSNRAIGDATAGLKGHVVSCSRIRRRENLTSSSRANKAVANMARKFERFDNGLQIQSRDQEQRVRKLNAGARPVDALLRAARAQLRAPATSINRCAAGAWLSTGGLV